MKMIRNAVKLNQNIFVWLHVLKLLCENKDSLNTSIKWNHIETKLFTDIGIIHFAVIKVINYWYKSKLHCFISKDSNVETEIVLIIYGSLGLRWIQSIPFWWVCSKTENTLQLQKYPVPSQNRS